MELCEAAQLCVFILGMGYFSLGVLRRVFGVRYAASVLIRHDPQSSLKFGGGGGGVLSVMARYFTKALRCHADNIAPKPAVYVNPALIICNLLQTKPQQGRLSASKPHT